jgi:putative ABC transport system ATP-binding protein
MNPSSSIVKVQNLGKTYFLGKVPVHALLDVSFTIPPEQVVFIMGPSGSGKTTLLNLIGGIDKPSGGDLWVCSENIASYSSKQLTKFRKNHLSFVFQFYSLIPTLTALENVELILELGDHKRKDIRKIAKSYLQMVELEDRINNFPSQLSGGERQRVAIARALAKNPDLLLIDEPTGQLDQVSGQKVVEIIRNIARKHHKTVMLVTHDPDLIPFADRVIELRSGKITKDILMKE